MPTSRTRNTQHKVYIPSSARDNQYLMAKIPLTTELLSKYADLIDVSSTRPYAKLYQKLAKLFFTINDELAIESSQFIANDKFARVRYSPEKLISETKQQLLFLYNPKYHTSQNAFFDGEIKAKKLTLLFLANGDELRVNSAAFHQQVINAITKFTEQTGLRKQDIRVSDHQHLTYDLFAKDKGVEGTQIHKFRSLANRYLTENQILPNETDALTYAVVDFPINRRVRSMVAAADDNTGEQFNELYNLIADAFISSAKNQNLHNGAFIANGLVPIVRKGEDENVIANGELLMLGYNPSHTSCGYTCKWDSAKLVDTIQLIFVASDQNKSAHGYGKFVNQIELALRAFAQRLDFVNDKEEMLVRLHQHIGFYLD
ncbi:MAG: hypothetical protein COB83_09155 [Gammaproteobacteria bacterium]|nr:MAG: hypothetical protein COB83_09155 [Gammaproteobacteria bacterium]